MFRSYRIGTLFGFPIEVNVSFLILLGIVLLWMGGLAGVFVVLIAFGSVLLHELGHAVVARRLGVPVPGIELHFFGGAAKMGGQPKDANDEIAIAAAGPAVSFALGGIGMILASATGFWLFQTFGWINLILGGFNLIPALPMDGGRIFRALLTRRYSFARATDIAVKVARGFAVLLAAVGLFTLQIYLILLAGVLWFMGTAELRASRYFGYSGAAAYGGAPEVEVLPRGYRPGRGGFAGRVQLHRPVPSGGFVVRRQGGRVWVEFIRS